VLARAVHGQNRAPRKPFRLARRRVFEGLRAVAKPHLDDAIAAQAPVDTARDRFHLGQFRHRSIVEGGASPIA
jgi:hypothetical protein